MVFCSVQNGQLEAEISLCKARRDRSIFLPNSRTKCGTFAHAQIRIPTVAHCAGCVAASGFLCFDLDRWLKRLPRISQERLNVWTWFLCQIVQNEEKNKMDENS